MKPEEYITTIFYNGKMINVGADDAGQEFFLEYVDEDGNPVEEGCGAYNTNYMEVIEALFGDPKDCEHYGFGMCDEHLYSHGYCGQCPYNPRFVESNIRMRERGSK